ncbi:MAG: hypothetical protein ACTSU5_11165 [Promethearchaeota archaeon]
MTHRDMRPLYEHGFDEHMVEVYLSLLHLGRASIKAVREEVNSGGRGSLSLSYSQVRHALVKLVGRGAAEKHPSAENTYTPVNPKKLFEEIREARLAEMVEVEGHLSELYERTTRQFGLCTLKANNFHFKSLDLGLKILSDRFLRAARESIVFLAPPPPLLRYLRWGLGDAYARGAKVEIHYSKWDFEELPDYFNEVKPFLTYRAAIFKRKHRIYEATSVDDEFTRVGNLIVDRTAFVMVPYYRAKVTAGTVEYGMDFLHGFNRFSSYIPAIFEGLAQNPVEERFDFIPQREALVLDFLREHPRVSKSRLASGVGISGTELKRVTKVLEKHGLVRVERRLGGRGRPTEVVELV